MPEIIDIVAREILDSRGNPTVEVDVTLDDKVLARLDEIFPGHKTAPEDYAW